MTRIVVSQPMYFPWVGLFEQVRLADTYVHYTDVQLPQGRSFINRVQIKTHDGVKWLTVPLRRGKVRIDEAVVDSNQDWRGHHKKILEHAYARAPFAGEMMSIIDRVFELDTNSICELNCFALELLSDYFELRPEFLNSAAFGLSSASSERLLDIMLRLGGTVYITGHGARDYLDHELFARKGIEVEYMAYDRVPYAQLHGEFTPYVSILDLIANGGRAGREVIRSRTISWRAFVA